MASGIKVGVFDKSTNTGVPVDQAITDVGFQPKALILFSTLMTFEAALDASYGGMGVSRDYAATMSRGITTGPSNSYSVAIYGQYGAQSPNTGASRHAAKALTLFSVGVGDVTTLLAECDLKSFDSGGFTLTWTTNDAYARKIYYIAFGGPDITNAKALMFSGQSGTGNKTYTGIGFQGDFLFLINSSLTAATVPQYAATESHIGIGAAVSSSKRWAHFNQHQGSQTNDMTVNSYCYQRSDSVLLTMSGGATEENRYDFVSFNSDGFVLNHIVNGTAALAFGALVIQGGDWDIGYFDKPTTGTLPLDQSVSGMAFQPDGYFITEGYRAYSTSPQITSFGTGGATDGTTKIFSHHSMDDTVGVTGANSSGTGAVAHCNWVSGHVKHKTIDSTGFTVTYYTSLGTLAQRYHWFATKLAPPAGSAAEFLPRRGSFGQDARLRR